MCCSTDANKQGRAGWRCDYESVEFMDEEKAGQQVSLQPQTLGELTLASTGIFLEEFYRNRPCRVRGSKRVG